MKIAELKELMLREPRLTLAVAESLTGGLVQAGVASISGASNFFLGGITAYSLEQKVKHLGVDHVAAERVNCVSADVAEQMAHGACALFGADVGVATTGYAEPSLADGVAVPFAWWALIVRGEGMFAAKRGRVECPGATRVQAQQTIADVAVAELIAALREVRHVRR